MAEKTVLIVDDEQAFLEGLEDALLHLRYRVRKAATVESALKILQAERIDLATVDIMLPAGDSLEDVVPSKNAGLYLCEQIARRFPQVRAICMSVVTDKEVIRRVREMGFGFLRKGDVPLRSVLDTIGTTLSRGRGDPHRQGKTKLKGW